MKTYFLYHYISKPGIRLDFMNLPDTFSLADYELIAKFVTDDINDIFRLTQSVNCHWSETEEFQKGVKSDKIVYYRENNQIRSTSVGDVYITHNVDAESDSFMVDMVGFKNVKSV